MAWLRRGLLALAVLLLVAAAGGYLWLRTSLPRLSGEISLAGATSEIEIIRDRNAVPHIRAANADDAYFGLGFVHAQDRLFQMDFMRRLGAGKLSEVVGPATLPLDRMMRLLGLYRAAEQSVARLSPEARRMLEAYSAGVNAFLTQSSGSLPPEFLVLGYRPTPWRPADSLVWARIMAMRLTGNWRDEALRARLSSRLSAGQIDELWPEDDSAVPPTIAVPGAAAASPPRSATPPALAAPPASVAPPAARAALKKLRAMFADLVEGWPREMAPLTASNSWVVDGARSVTGKPILANDPHLGFRAPGLWYLARIEAPGLTLTGATVPGVPYHLLGHNGRIAWGFTTTGSDTQDLFIERIDPADPTRYLTPGGSRAFETRQEIIPVAGGPDVTVTLRRTRHGPVLSDLASGAGRRLASIAGPGYVVALAAVALRDDDMTAEGLYRLNRAGNWDEFRAALRLFHAPQQNITYADVAGNIGFVAPGRVPIRKSGDGATPAPGWTGSHDWRGFIPYDDLPAVLNPASGRIVNANHRVIGKSYRYDLGRFTTPSYRAERIYQMLDATPQPYGLDSFAAMQLDIVSLMARDLVPLMTRIAPGDERARRALALLRGWNLKMARDRPEPLIFIAWLRTFNRLLYGDELGNALPSYWGLRPLFVRNVLKRDAKWCDDRSSAKVETCDAVLETSLSKTLDELEAAHGGDLDAWRWGDDHYALFSHPLFGRIAGLRRLADIRIASDGGAYTVNRAQHRSNDRDKPFASVHGPGYRAIYDLADLDRSRFIQATGQSGNLLSGNYRDLTRAWRDGGYISIPESRARALDGAIGVLILKPAS
jgi:penicillin G amidase